MGTAHHHCRGMSAPQSGHTDSYEKDPTINRALALALMRQAYKLLQAASECDAADQLQVAVNTLLPIPRITPTPIKSAR